MTVLLVLLGGAAGAPLRYLTDLAIQSRHDSVFPWGTFTVNAVGSFVLGLTVGAVSAADGPSWVVALVGTGFCGALTTFSTFQIETFEFARDGDIALAVGYPVASIAAGMALAVGGVLIARWGRHW